MGLSKKVEVKDMAQELKKIVDDYKKNGYVNYIDIAEYTGQILDTIYSEEEYSLPIDINRIVEYFEIEVCEINLNDRLEGQTRCNRIVGELSVRPRIFAEGEIKCIYVDSEATLYTQRYALAHELGHYLINKAKKLYRDEYCIMPLLPRDAEELIADAFAVSLLIPIKVFVNKFNLYIEEEKTNDKLPIGTENWLQYLSTSAKVSYHYVACGYQQLRFVAFWLYQYKMDKLRLQEADNESNAELQAQLEEKEKKYPFLIKNIDKCLSNEVVEVLFQ